MADTFTFKNIAVGSKFRKHNSSDNFVYTKIAPKQLMGGKVTHNCSFEVLRDGKTQRRTESMASDTVVVFHR